MDIDTFIITHIFLIFFSTLNVQYLHKRNYLRKRSGAQISRSGNKLEGGSRSKYVDSRTQSFPNTACLLKILPGPRTAAAPETKLLVGKRGAPRGSMSPPAASG